MLLLVARLRAIPNIAQRRIIPPPPASPHLSRPPALSIIISQILRRRRAPAEPIWDRPLLLGVVVPQDARHVRVVLRVPVLLVDPAERLVARLCRCEDRGEVRHLFVGLGLLF